MKKENLPDITGRTALAVRPDAVNAKYHVITNATYNRDPVPAKFKHVTNIDTCTLLCCDYTGNSDRPNVEKST